VCHALLQNLDEEIAAETRLGRCRCCSAALHRRIRLRAAGDVNKEYLRLFYCNAGADQRTRQTRLG
jgi:hypothetical protein